MDRSKHFSRREMQCKCCGDCYINPELFNRLEELRLVWGRPIHIYSAYRCIKHNSAVGGHKDSQHLKGNAIDIATHSLSAFDKYHLIRLAYQVGFKGIAQAKRFLHLDVRKEGATWVY